MFQVLHETWICVIVRLCLCVGSADTAWSLPGSWLIWEKQAASGCAEDVWGVIIHCSVKRMLNSTQSVTEYGSENTFKASILLTDISLWVTAGWGGITDSVTFQFKLQKKEPTLSLMTGLFVAEFKSRGIWTVQRAFITCICYFMH